MSLIQNRTKAISFQGIFEDSHNDYFGRISPSRCNNFQGVWKWLTNRTLFPISNSAMAETPELAAQNAKFGYKAPESVYNKHKPGMAAQGAIGIS